MAHDSGSFDYKTINTNIRNVLAARSVLDNTVQVSMPFVKATTTLRLPKIFGGVGDKANVGFTLGIHALYKDSELDDILSSKNSNMPLVGYTYQPNGETKNVYAIDSSADSTAKIFDRQGSLYTNANYITVPPPGITSLSISRMKSGRVGQATLNITVPSLIQLETLHRTFLIPGVGMVVEWGQQFAINKDNPDVGEIPDITNYLFPWTDRNRLDIMLRNLALNKYGLKNILQDYVYPTQGQYMWMFGRVANFSVKGKGDGSFECTVKVVGPAEDAWAYSTKNTIVPAKDPSAQFFCSNNTTSVYSYFTETVPGFNLKSLLDSTLDPNTSSPWSQHVLKFTQENADEGKPTEENKEQSNTSQKTFADSEEAYLFTWRFFVNVVLNDPNVGLLGIFKKANLSSAELEKIGLLRPYAHGPNREIVDVANVNPDAYQRLDDPLESFVGANKYLRSTDPTTMMIVSEEAVKFAIANPQYNRAVSAEKMFEASDESRKMLAAGDFTQGALPYVTDSTNPDKGFLSSGVWLSHKGVIEAMIGADTVLRGISNLLERMNQATGNYWKLALDVSDGDVSQNLGHNYSVIDMNLRESSDKAVDKFLNDVHVFNKYVRVNNGQLVGSELIDCSIDLNLPKLLFSQIATMGLVHPEDAQGAGVDTAAGQAPPKSPKLMQDDRLRKMFAITSLATTEDGQLLADTEQGPDLTILPKKERRDLVAANNCGATNTNTTAQTAGEGTKAGETPIDPNFKDATVDDLQKKQDEAKAELEGKLCQMCANCKTVAAAPAAPPPIASPLSQVGAAIVAAAGGTPATPAGPTTKLCDTLSGTNERLMCNRAYNAGITNTTELAQFLGQCKQETGFKVVSEDLYYRSGEDIYKTFNKKTTKTIDGKVQKVVVEPPSRVTREKADTLAKNPEKLGSYIYANMLGNGPESSKEGYKYRGRGFIQLTGKVQYEAFSKRSGIDIVTNPDAVLNDPVIAADVSVDYWKQNVKPKVNNFSDTTKVTRYINAGLLGLSERDKYFNEYLQKFNSGVVVAPTAPPRTVAPAPTANSAFGAVFVSGLTDVKSAQIQWDTFKRGAGQDKRIFSAQYTQISEVKSFLAKNPKIPVFLYSKAAQYVNQLIDDPNVDKQKLFLIEPYLAGAGTRASAVSAVQKGMPASNIYAGPIPIRGGGDKKIPGSSDTPSQYDHYEAPAYVGQQKASLMKSTATVTSTSPNTETSSPSANNTTSNTPLFDGNAFCYGDSIAVGFCGKRLGSRRVGAPPSEILRYLRTDVERYRGKKVILSTGISNGVGEIATIEQQFKLLKNNNINVTVIGAAAGRFDAENKKLQELTSTYGFRFLGPFIPGDDGVHPKTYSRYESPTGTTPVPAASTPTTPATKAPTATGPSPALQSQPWKVANHNVGRELKKPPSLAAYRNGYLPNDVLVPVEGVCGGGCKLYREAAAQYVKMVQAAKDQQVEWTLSSAYRGYTTQANTKAASKVKGAAAPAGSSPHGLGMAIDIRELRRYVDSKAPIIIGTDGKPTPNIVDYETNRLCRANNKIFQWIAENGPKFGWYNPVRLWDYAGQSEECWHFEYWGETVSMSNPPTSATPTYTGTPTAPQAAPQAIPNPPVVSQNVTVCSDQELLDISKENSLLDFNASVDEGREICNKCRRLQTLAAQTAVVIAEKQQVETVTREFAKYEKIFRYVEIFPDYMISSITDDADGNRANAFGASPGTLSISADLVMPGINGLRVGELFWVDRMPAFYRAFGAFQIMNIEDTISISDGWKTKVHSVFNYMGTMWKSRMTELLNGVER